jgi:hypothetical protein
MHITCAALAKISFDKDAHHFAHHLGSDVAAASQDEQVPSFPQDDAHVVGPARKGRGIGSVVF